MAEICRAFPSMRRNCSIEFIASWLQRALAAMRRGWAAVQRHREGLRHAREYRYPYFKFNVN